MVGVVKGPSLDRGKEALVQADVQRSTLTNWGCCCASRYLRRSGTGGAPHLRVREQAAALIRMDCETRGRLRKRIGRV